MKQVSLVLIAIVFVVAGVMHFVRPGIYARIIPPFLPFPMALVYISGVAEILGGIGVLIPSLRAWAGIGLIALLIAVFPANLYMALAPERAGFGIAAVWLWLRLPLQLVVIAWVWWATRAGV
ncbi:MAG: DoxX family protein [Gemmatimonadetes bacterium]|nr:DoxX family protein [Gemmatimonadota bacterium]